MREPKVADIDLKPCEQKTNDFGMSSGLLSKYRTHIWKELTGFVFVNRLRDRNALGRCSGGGVKVKLIQLSNFNHPPLLRVRLVKLISQPPCSSEVKAVKQKHLPLSMLHS